MTVVEALNQAIELMNHISVTGEDNLNNMLASIQMLKNIRAAVTAPAPKPEGDMPEPIEIKMEVEE